MRLGFLLDEKSSEKLIETAEYAEITPHALLVNAIDVMSNAYKKDEPDAERGETSR